MRQMAIGKVILIAAPFPVGFQASHHFHFPDIGPSFCPSHCSGCYSFNFALSGFTLLQIGGLTGMKLAKTLGAVCIAVVAVSAIAATTPATPPTVTISVDATHAPRKIFHAALKIPAAPGDLTLYYPKWIPGEHAPDGPVIDLAGLKFSAAGKTLKRRRDLLDGFTLHVDVPAGEGEITAELDFLSPATFEGGFSAGSSATDKLAVISWNQVLLYPKGFKSDDINYTASLKIPDRKSV